MVSNKTIKYFKKIEKQIPQGYFLHISTKKINYKDPNFKKLKIKQIDNLKPSGLWLSGGISESDSWINWVVIQEQMDWYEPPSKFYYYSVNIDFKSPKILILNTKDKLLDFHKKYKSSNNLYEIKWSKLDKEGYYGIYFKYFQDLVDKINTFADENKTIREMIWYVSLDCACICVWNNKLILDIKEITI